MFLFDSTAKTNWIFLGIIALAATVVAADVFVLLQPTDQQSQLSQQQEEKQYESSVVVISGLQISFPETWKIQHVSESEVKVLAPFEDKDIFTALSVSELEELEDFGSGRVYIGKIKNGALYGLVTKSGICRWGIELKDNGIYRYYDVAASFNVDSPVQNNKWSGWCNLWEDVLESVSIEVVSQDDISDWQTYRNEEYGFEVRHPENWRVEEFPNHVAPVFNIYDPAVAEQEPPFTHFANAVHVSVYPEGYGIDGPVGQFQESVVNFQEPTRNARDLLVSDTPRAIYAQFRNAPASWTEHGYIWGIADATNVSAECWRGEEIIALEDCRIYDGNDEIIHKGEVDAESWNTVEQILSTFRFVD